MTNHLRFHSQVMLTAIFVSLPLASAAPSSAATDVKVPFTLNTKDAAGKPITQNRFYYVYRPDKLSKDSPVPMVIVFECRGGDLPAKFYHRKADEAGFVLVSAAIQGNSTGNAVWVNDNPRESGWEDMDYTSEVIDRVKKDENCRDVFVTGISKGGHMTCAVACELSKKIKAAADLDEFMGLTTNIPQAPVPMLFIHGTKDNAVPYAMVKDTVEAWRAKNGLMNVTPVTTFEPSPKAPGAVTQTTWEGPNPVAFVTIIGGTHVWPVPEIQTGYDVTDASWAFFAQFITPQKPAPKITSPSLINVQYAGKPASFHVSVIGEGELTVQWQKDNQDIAGATKKWYTTPPLTKADDGAHYGPLIRSKAGSASGAGNVKVLDAPPGPTIAKHPIDQTTVAGKAVTFTVLVGSSAQVKFQWQQNGMDIVGATEASLTVNVPTTWDCGSTYRCIVTDTSGSSSSIPATLTVTPAQGQPVIVTNPARARLKPGENCTFSVVARSGMSMTYQWQKCTLTTNYVDIPGATSDTYAPPPATLGDHRTLFRCIVTNKSGAAASAGEMMLVTEKGATTKARNQPASSD